MDRRTFLKSSLITADPDSAAYARQIEEVLLNG